MTDQEQAVHDLIHGTYHNEIIRVDRLPIHKRASAEIGTHFSLIAGLAMLCTFGALRLA